MSDTISRQAAIDALGERPMVWVGSDYELGARNQYDADVLALETVPSVQPQRKTGKWIEYDNSHCECPFCHTEWSYFDNEVEHFDFCPRCGAKMEAET